MEFTRKTVASLAVVLVLVLAGCAGGGPDAGTNPAADGNGGNGGNGDGMSGPPASSDDGYSVDEVDDVVVQDRARIKTGEVQLEVDDFDEARRNLSATVESYGGFVSESNERRNRVDNQTFTTGLVVLRVPREDFSAMMEAVRTRGTVIESHEDEEDVTEQLVDLEARLDNLEAQRDRLRSLYEDANDTRDILDVEERLTEVQTEIERLEATKQSLERKVALSTIRIELFEPEPDPESDSQDVERWYETGVLSAFLDSVSGVVVTARAVVVAAAYVLPYAIAFGVPLAIAGFGIRRRRETRTVDESVVSDDDDE